MIIIQPTSFAHPSMTGKTILPTTNCFMALSIIDNNKNIVQIFEDIALMHTFNHVCQFIKNLLETKEISKNFTYTLVTNREPCIEAQERYLSSIQRLRENNGFN